MIIRSLVVFFTYPVLFLQDRNSGLDTQCWVPDAEYMIILETGKRQRLDLALYHNDSVNCITNEQPGLVLVFK
jgi:hypothetical protein